MSTMERSLGRTGEVKTIYVLDPEKKDINAHKVYVRYICRKLAVEIIRL